MAAERSLAKRRRASAQAVDFPRVEQQSVTAPRQVLATRRGPASRIGRRLLEAERERVLGRREMARLRAALKRAQSGRDTIQRQAAITEHAAHMQELGVVIRHLRLRTPRGDLRAVAAVLASDKLRGLPKRTRRSETARPWISILPSGMSQ